MKTIASKEEFDEILATSADRVVIVMYTASWCRPCIPVMPIFKDMERDHPNAILNIVDVVQSEDLAAENEVAGLPTVQFFKDGKKIHEVIGHNIQKLVDAFKKYAP